MKHLIQFILILFSISFLSSCESCVRKTSKKITELGITALNSASDVIAEHGETTGEKAAGALGNLTKGVGKGLDRFLKNEALANESESERMFVEFTDTVNIDESGMKEINHSATLPENASLEYIGILSEYDALCILMGIAEEGTYDCTLQFVNNKNNIELEKKLHFSKGKQDGRYAGIGIVLTDSETEKFNNSKKAKISVTKRS